MKNNSRTTIRLIRHGDVYNPKQIIYGRAVDVPLTEKGKQQLTFLGKILKKYKISPDLI